MRIMFYSQNMTINQFMVNKPTNLLTSNTNHTQQTIMNRLELLTQREQLMENIDSIVELVWSEYFGDSKLEVRDELITQLCDNVCETIDPAGLV